MTATEFSTTKARSAHPMARACRLAKERGMTLIELLVVIVIVGVLAVVSVNGYRKMIVSSHITEATNTVQAIRVAEEAYHAEAQAYYGTQTTSFTTAGGCPSAGLGAVKTQPWGAAGSACATAWAPLPVHTDGPLLFGYAVTAGKAGTTPVPAAIPPTPSIGTAPTATATSTAPIGTTSDWYIIGAWNNYDGASGVYAQVYGVSASSDLFVFNEGN